MSNDKVCRLCLELISSETCQDFDNMKLEMLQFLSLNLDRDVSKNPVICSNCVENLQLSFDFRTSCLTNSNYFRNHMRSCNPDVLGSVNMSAEGDSLEVSRGEKIICKFCLNYYEKNSLKEINREMEEDVVLRIMFEKCLPEIDINIEKQLMCQNCLEFLQIQFNFIITCLDNEEKIKNVCCLEEFENFSDILNKIKKLKHPNISNDVKLEPEDVNIEDYISNNLLEIKKEEIETIKENEYHVKEEKDELQEDDSEEKLQTSCAKRRRKTRNKKKTWSEEDLETAIKLILDEEVSVERAAKDFNINKCTLLYHLKMIKSENSNHRTILTNEEEITLLRYLKIAARIHYGLTPVQIRVLAYEYAALNNKKIYSWMKELRAGEQWLKNFQEKYKKDFPFLKQQAGKLKRPMVFNRKTVCEIFGEYKTLLRRFEFNPADIWSCAETAIPAFHIRSLRGKNHGVNRSCDYWGANITMISAVSASGNSIPPMLIFPRIHVKSSILNGAPQGTIAEVNPSGWSNEFLFGNFVNHFIKHVKSSVEKPVLLLVDNHEDHIIIPVIDAAQKSGVVLVTIPSCTSHKMQPLERGVFRLFRKYYNESLCNWMSLPCNLGKMVNIYGIAPLIGNAYAKAFTTDNIMKGFSASGFVPFNENIFTDEDFMVADVTEQTATRKENEKCFDSLPNGQ